MKIVQIAVVPASDAARAGYDEPSVVALDNEGRIFIRSIIKGREWRQLSEVPKDWTGGHTATKT